MPPRTAEGWGEDVEAVRAALRTSMCPICRCVGTMRVYRSPRAQADEVVCLRCGTDLSIEDGTDRHAAGAQLVCLRVAMLSGVRPAGEPEEIARRKAVSIARWLELTRADGALLRRLAEEASVRPKTRFRPPRWKSRFEGNRRNPLSYAGIGGLVALTVVPLLWILGMLDTFIAVVAAVTAGVIAAMSYILSGRSETPSGSVTLPLLVAPENEPHLLNSLETVLTARQVNYRPSGEKAAISSVAYRCENDSFTIRFERGSDPGNPNLLFVTVEPVTKENSKYLDVLCRALTNMFVELGYHLLPIPESQGGVVALER